MSLKVLVIDDTVLFRRIISEALEGLPDVQVIGSAATGKTALARMSELGPDLVTLDVEMPDMNGLEVLAEMRRRAIPAGIIMVSSLTAKGSDLTVRALELGAFDFFTKPTGTSIDENRQALRTALGPRLKAFARRREIKAILHGAPAAPAPPAVPASAPPRRPESSGDLASFARSRTAMVSKGRVEMVVIGVSTGGPVALGHLIPQLPANLNLPVLIVQHMPPLFTHALAASLNARSAIRVREAQDNDRLEPNVAYIAPGKQMKVVPGLDGAKVLRITDDPPENNCRPAVDYLFRSVANHFPGQAVAVIMTGMGSDGTLGLRLLKRGGCFAIAQDEASCVVFGMPAEAIKAGVVDLVVPLADLAPQICKAVGGC